MVSHPLSQPPKRYKRPEHLSFFQQAASARPPRSSSRSLQDPKFANLVNDARAYLLTSGRFVPEAPPPLAPVDDEIEYEELRVPVVDPPTKESKKRKAEGGSVGNGKPKKGKFEEGLSG